MMPSPLYARTCEYCGATWETRSRAPRTCSPLCRARLREIEHGRSKGSPRRDYPPEIVEQIRTLYAEGMTTAEVQDVIGPGIKVYNVMRRHGIERRIAAKRHQSGEDNHMWRGDDAGYQALHLRVEGARGKPQRCERCGTTDRTTRYEWANLTGSYEDVTDYERMCVGCHRRYDAARRAATGERTSPVRRSA